MKYLRIVIVFFFMAWGGVNKEMVFQHPVSLVLLLFLGMAAGFIVEKE